MKKVLGMLIVVVMLFSLVPITHANDVNNSWEYQGDLPFLRNGAGVVELDGKVYIVGGYDGTAASNRVDVYNSTTDTWSQVSGMNTARSAFGISSANGKIYVVGGVSGNPLNNYSSSAILKSVEEFDPASGTWTNKASLPKGRQYTNAVTLSGEIYLVGGLTGNTAQDAGTNEVLKFNPNTNTWAPVANLNYSLHAVGLVAFGGKIYAIGGGNTTNYNFVQIYDPSSNIWTTIVGASMPTSRDALSTVVYNNKIYAIGGITAGTSGGITNSVEVFDPATNTWSTDTSLNQARFDQTAVILNGTIYVFGGSGIKTVEKYVSSKPQEPEQPHHGRALLTIYISGGQIKEYDLSAVELNTFLNWYDAKDAGSGPAKYAFAKTWNKGPFKTRTEYVIFDKILTFDVDEYEVENP